MYYRVTIATGKYCIQMNMNSFRTFPTDHLTRSDHLTQVTVDTGSTVDEKSELWYVIEVLIHVFNVFVSGTNTFVFYLKVGLETPPKRAETWKSLSAKVHFQFGWSFIMFLIATKLGRSTMFE